MEQNSSQRKSYEHTYFVQDNENRDERDRLSLQDQMITRAMGGVLPEQNDSQRFRRVLDVGCGTGGWLIEVAKAYPEIKTLIGIDINRQMVEYAQKLAEQEQVHDRVEFHTMDALLFIEFPRHFFDLVNQRLGWSYLRTWDWHTILTKYLYIARPDAVIRITEGTTFDTTTSPALAQLFQVGFDALYRAGHSFTPEPSSVAERIPHLFREFGLRNIETRSTLFEHRIGSESMDIFFEDVKLLFRTGLPFYRKWGNIPPNYEELYQQALEEIQDPGCLTTGHLVTTWGTTNG